MKKENFKQIIQTWIYQTEKVNKVYELGIEIFEITDEYWKIINPLLEEVFTEEQIELMEEFVYNDNRSITVEELFKDVYKPR